MSPRSSIVEKIVSTAISVANCILLVGTKEIFLETVIANAQSKKVVIRVVSKVFVIGKGPSSNIFSANNVISIFNYTSSILLKPTT